MVFHVLMSCLQGVPIFFSANSSVSSGASSTEPLSTSVFFDNKSSLHSATKSATRHANDIGKLRILSANADGLFNNVPELHLCLPKEIVDIDSHI